MSISLPFLTELDSRAQVKGSRDPLGLVTIWAHFGRRGVGNLTTVATSLRDFTLRVLGQWVVERVAERHPDSQHLPTFLRFEQLCNYSRYRHDQNAGFRGVERVRINLDGNHRVTLSAAAEHQLLSNQRAYGVWGFYSVPCVSSGLLQQDQTLSADGQALVEKTCLPFLRNLGIDSDRDLVRLIAEPKSIVDLEGRHRPLAEALGKLLAPSVRANERPFYEHHLLFGGPADPTHCRQAILAKILAKTLDDEDSGLSPTLLRAVTKEAAKESDQLAADLDAIRVCESVLAPASRIFGWLAQCKNQSRDSLVKILREQLGAKVPTEAEAFRALRAHFPEGAATDVGRWVRLADALAAGDYRAVVDLLLELNAYVMKERGGAGPWLEFRDGKLSVRFRDEASGLPEAEELPGLWLHSYFVDSLRTMAGQVWGRP